MLYFQKEILCSAILITLITTQSSIPQMADLSHPPRSPTLVPPRKSVELEDSGAHDLGTYWRLSAFYTEVSTTQVLTAV